MRGPATGQPRGSPWEGRLQSCAVPPAAQTVVRSAPPDDVRKGAGGNSRAPLAAAAAAVGLCYLRHPVPAVLCLHIFGYILKTPMSPPPPGRHVLHELAAAVPVQCAAVPKGAAAVEGAGAAVRDRLCRMHDEQELN